MEELTLGNAAEEMVRAVPELRPCYEKLAAERAQRDRWVSLDRLLHDCLKPLLARTRDHVTLTRVFDFLERFCCAMGEKRRHEAEQAIVYPLFYDSSSEVRRRVRSFMGPETASIVDEHERLYEYMSRRLVEVIPELKAAHEDLLEWWGDGAPGLHVMYGDLIDPYLKALLESDDQSGVLARVFQLFEEMATHDSDWVQNVLCVTNLEYLLGCSKDIRERARRVMGPETAKHYDRMAKAWGRLPEEQRTEEAE